MDAIEQLFLSKTQEATRILADSSAKAKTVDETQLPFEVNKVLGKIREETDRRTKLSKRKPVNNFIQVVDGSND